MKVRAGRTLRHRFRPVWSQQPAPSREELLQNLYHALNAYLIACDYQPLNFTQFESDGVAACEPYDDRHGRCHFRVTSHMRSFTIRNLDLVAAEAIGAAVQLLPGTHP